MSFTISTLTLEAFLLVLVRVACFTSIAPIFGHNSLNARMKISIAFFVSLILYQVVDVSLPEYTNVLGYTTLVLEEALVGLQSLLHLTCDTVMFFSDDICLQNTGG